MSRPGRKFQQDCRASLIALGARCWSYDNTGTYGTVRLPCDLEACVPPIGRSLLVECKEMLAGQSLSFRRVERHQLRSLLAQEEAGGLGLLLVKWQAGKAARCFACHASEWALLIGELSVVELALRHESEWEALLAGLEGRKSVPLADGKRPACLVEVPRRRVGEALVWDLREVLGLAGGVGEVAA